MGLEPTTFTIRVRRATHYVTPPLVCCEYYCLHVLWIHLSDNHINKFRFISVFCKTLYVFYTATMELTCIVQPMFSTKYKHTFMPCPNNWHAYIMYTSYTYQTHRSWMLYSQATYVSVQRVLIVKIYNTKRVHVGSAKFGYLAGYHGVGIV